MIRVAAWTVGLFAVGTGICHFFPGPWIEPLVLLGLGATLFVLGGRMASPARRSDSAPRPVSSPLRTRAAR